MHALSSRTSARARLLTAMALFGTIGIFVRYLPLPSSVIALVRGLVGTVFLLAIRKKMGRRMFSGQVRQQLTALGLSGIAIGINWILLFESYRYTTVASATLCYYMAPVFVILFSPVLFGERLSVKKLLCVAVALGGMVLVSGAAENGLPAAGELRGLLLGLGAAVFYASVILTNKALPEVDPYDKTFVQLAAASLVLLPYVLLTQPISTLTFTPLSLLLLAVLGVVHTGFAYTLYFGAAGSLPAQTIALFSYTDPIVAIFLSALVLGEPLTPLGLLGAAMILGAALVSDLS